eukprot:CAMPEP_0197528100 /NCGR_PEP_ID=MMETSP1318-20131121/23867_1 /TAXON_ID=552666 /ORGANISM="Partenskyella glossopodia, Strain RCC365" /LENGTH=521 /DNA_ID=CAMNT_0043083041 /DNA_START=87 /DNA_END=1652 /DNA_ORIENTATION=-
MNSSCKKWAKRKHENTDTCMDKGDSKDEFENEGILKIQNGDDAERDSEIFEPRQTGSKAAIRFATQRRTPVPKIPNFDSTDIDDLNLDTTSTTTTHGSIPGSKAVSAAAISIFSADDNVNSQVALDGSFEFETKLENIRRQILELQAEADSLRCKNFRLTTNLSETKESNTKLDKELSNAVDTCRILGRENDALVNSEADMRIQIEKLHCQTSVQCVEIEALKQRNRELEKTLLESHLLHSNVIDDSNEISHANKRQKRELAVHRAKLEMKIKEVKKLKAEKSKLHDEKDQIQSQIVSLQAQMDTISKKFATAQEEFHKQKEVYESRIRGGKWMFINGPRMFKDHSNQELLSKDRVGVTSNHQERVDRILNFSKERHASLRKPSVPSSELEKIIRRHIHELNQHNDSVLERKYNELSASESANCSRQLTCATKTLSGPPHYVRKPPLVITLISPSRNKVLLRRKNHNKTTASPTTRRTLEVIKESIRQIKQKPTSPRLTHSSIGLNQYHNLVESESSLLNE